MQSLQSPKHVKKYFIKKIGRLLIIFNSIHNRLSAFNESKVFQFESKVFRMIYKYIKLSLTQKKHISQHNIKISIYIYFYYWQQSKSEKKNSGKIFHKIQFSNQ